MAIYVLLTGLLGLIVIIVYFALALLPEEVSHTLVRQLRAFENTKYDNYFWKYIDRIKTRRKIIIVLLIFLLVICISTNALLLVQLALQHISLQKEILNFGIILLITPITIYAFENIRHYGEHKFISVRHGKTKDVETIINNLSAGFGIPVPEYIVISNTNPTAFTVAPAFKKPIIYLTTGLVNILDRNELETVLAHEVSHIASGRVLDYRKINYLLTMLKLFSFMIIIFLLWAENLQEIAMMIGAYSIIFLITAFDKDEFIETLDINPTKIIQAFNPSFVIVNFLSNWIYYALAFDEEIYADLNAAQTTRNPSSLHSALHKISEHRWLTQSLPTKYAHLYFTGESVGYHTTPISQPSITERKQVLQSIDNTLKNAQYTKTKSNLKCPKCSKAMKEIQVSGPYSGITTIDQCPSCASLWFDERELYYIATFLNLANTTYPDDINTNNEYLCPRCEIPLQLLKDQNIPQSIEIHRCASCNGNFLEHSDVIKYNQYREAKISSRQKI